MKVAIPQAGESNVHCVGAIVLRSQNSIRQDLFKLEPGRGWYAISVGYYSDWFKVDLLKDMHYCYD